MDELINLVIDILYAIRYSPIFNKYRNFRKMLDNAVKVDGEIAIKLRKIAMQELDKVNVRNNGKPYYFYFESLNNGYYKLFVITYDYKFYCRLRDINVELCNDMPEKYYIIV